MSTKGEIRAFFWLAPGEVRTAAGGLRKALNEGVLPAQDYLNSITCCQTCADPAVCKSAIAANDVPASCRNAQLIAELKAV
ncbi:MAG: DUF6455 family protein [Rhodobacterales bacterium]|nr:DUF6455 family protein [Rhodobacterales bacterium]